MSPHVIYSIENHNQDCQGSVSNLANKLISRYYKISVRANYNQLQPNEAIQNYRPDKVRLLMAIGANSLQQFGEIFEAVEHDPMFSRNYLHVPGVPIATLRGSRELFPRMSVRGQEHALDCGAYEFEREQSRITPAVIGSIALLKQDDVWIMGARVQIHDYDQHRLYLLNSAFTTLKRFGKLFENGDRSHWLAKLHSPDPVIPLARFPGRVSMEARQRTISEYQSLTSADPVLLFPCLVRPNFAFDPSIKPIDDRVVRSPNIDHKSGYLERALRTAGQLPEATVIVASDHLPENVPPNVYSRQHRPALRPGPYKSGRMTISYFPVQQYTETEPS